MKKSKLEIKFLLHPMRFNNTEVTTPEKLRILLVLDDLQIKSIKKALEMYKKSDDKEVYKKELPDMYWVCQNSTIGWELLGYGLTVLADIEKQLQLSRRLRIDDELLKIYMRNAFMSGFEAGALEHESVNEDGNLFDDYYLNFLSVRKNEEEE
jgi:hypothetical protein